MTKGAISKVLDKLEARNWIERRTPAEDHRVQFISLTKQGAHALPGLAEIADNNDAHYFGGLDDADRAALWRLLRKLTELHQIRSVPME